MGYVLLDFDDAQKIRSVEVYYPRFEYRASWPVASLLRPAESASVTRFGIHDSFNQVEDEDMFPCETAENVDNRLKELRAQMREICDRLSLESAARREEIFASAISATTGPEEDGSAASCTEPSVPPHWRRVRVSPPGHI
jgi:hypothetical protein